MDKKDANDKEICEGDIVLCDDWVGAVEWDKDAALFYVRDDCDNPSLYEFRSSDLKVVGNIYQSKDWNKEFDKT